MIVSGALKAILSVPKHGIRIEMLLDVPPPAASTSGLSSSTAANCFRAALAVTWSQTSIATLGAVSRHWEVRSETGKCGPPSLVGIPSRGSAEVHGILMEPTGTLHELELNAVMRYCVRYPLEGLPGKIFDPFGAATATATSDRPCTRPFPEDAVRTSELQRTGPRISPSRHRAVRTADGRLPLLQRSAAAFPPTPRTPPRRFH